MTTFTTQDRVDAEITVEPIPFAGFVQLQDKDLTDEQINWFAKAYTDRNGKLNVIDFARAILRKASINE
jgi:Ca2+-binding EF-hand superfamily protein